MVDNGSTDDSVPFVRSAFPGVSIIELSENFGFARGYFLALNQIQAEYFVLLNSDVEVTEGWLEPLISAMDSDSTLGACMPRMRDFNRPDYFEYAGASGGFIDRFGYPFCRGRILDCVEIDAGQYDNEINIFWATGACMVVRSSAYQRAGGLDVDFFAHMEEIDLCWRLRRLGYLIKVIPKSTVYHVGGGTLPNNNPHKLYLNYRNNLFLLFKNLGTLQLLPLIFIRMVLDGMSAVVYLFSGSGPYFRAVLRAHAAFYRNLPALLKKRRSMAAMGTLKISEIYTGSILFDYFVRKRRHFSRIQW
jgi:GT2 family glycosyltransferase